MTPSVTPADGEPPAKRSTTGVVRAVAASLAKSLFLSGSLAVASFLAWQLDPRLRSLVLVLGSAALMLRGYGLEWHPTWPTCLLPDLTIG